MLLVSAEVGPFKSVEKAEEVEIEDGVTVLVGMNEAGKTVFLQALQKSDDVFDIEKFKPVDDYPRKNLNAYERRHATSPERVTKLTYRLSDEEAEELNKSQNVALPHGFQFSISHKYDNGRTIGIEIDEKPVLASLAASPNLSTEFRDAIRPLKSLREVAGAIGNLGLNDADKDLASATAKRVAVADKAKWQEVVALEVWGWLASRTPKFMYFGDYEVLR
jgi:hypothetical protein